MIRYNPHQWISHFFDIRGSMVREIAGRVAICTLWSAVVTYYIIEYRPELAVESTMHRLVGLVLSLLLVFRTNSAYDRFWEGRRLWGSIINESRNLARLAKAWLGDAPDLMREIVRWTATYPHAVTADLRGRHELGPIAKRLPPEEVIGAIGDPLTPLAVATRITELLGEANKRGVISDIVLTHIAQNVQLLIDYLGGCQRIHTTPIPFAYMVHLRRALVIYCLTLPFALAGEYGWAGILGTLLISFLMFGIEEIGVEIEDPFGVDANDLPLNEFCAIIERNLTEVIGDDTLPETEKVTDPDAEGLPNQET